MRSGTFSRSTCTPIPALLDEVNRAGKLAPGDLCCMAGFGSGFTWGSALLRW